MKNISLLFIVMVFSFAAKAQVIYSLDDDKIYIDSIVNITERTNSDSLRCLHSFRLSKLFLMAQNAEKAKEYLGKANNLKEKFPFLNDASLYYNAAKFLEKGDADGYEKTLVNANNQLKKYNTIEAFRLRAIILQNYGIMQQHKNNEKEYMNILVNEAIPIAKKSGENELISALYKAVAIIFMNTNEREKADYYINEAQNYVELATKKSPTLIESKVETYVINAENLILLKKFPQAKKVLNKAFLILRKYPESNLNESYYLSEGLYFAKQNVLGKALESYRKGILSSERHQNKLALNRLKFGEYEVFFQLKNYPKAKANLEFLLANTLFIVDKKNHYSELAKVYNAMGDAKKAYFYADKYNVVNDSLNKTKFKNEIVELEAKFNKIENEKKISTLQSQKEKAELIGRNNKLSTLLFGAASLLLFIVILFLWKYYQNQKKLNHQKELNHKQELISLENQQKLYISNALLEGEEVERKRIARDLHDGLGSMLSGVKIHLNQQAESDSGNLSDVNSLLDSSIRELRNISQNLMPESLLKLGLEHALRDLCFTLSNSNNSIEFQYLIEEANLDENHEIAIYRIIQELLNNAVKHSKATEILVSCSQNENVFFITVEDNGIGFDVSEKEYSIGMGLKNIKNRVEFLEGKIEIDSQPNRGTSTHIELQLRKSHASYF